MILAPPLLLQDRFVVDRLPGTRACRLGARVDVYETEVLRHVGLRVVVDEYAKYFVDIGSAGTRHISERNVAGE